MGKILPLLLALIGTGAGVGAGIYLTPAAGDEEQTDEVVCVPVAKSPEIAFGLPAVPKGPSEFVKLPNQFVIPVIRNDRVVSLVVAALSLEVKEGTSEPVHALEPKLRDVLLTVMIDHANSGGFDGAFTSGGRLDILRRDLRRAAYAVLGKDFFDVLITEIARQDS